MSICLSAQKVWLDPTVEVLRNSTDGARSPQSLDGGDLLLLKNGHGEIRSLAVENGSDANAGHIAIQVVRAEPVTGPAGHLDVSSHVWFLTQEGLSRLQLNSFAPGAADYQIDLSEDES